MDGGSEPTRSPSPSTEVRSLSDGVAVVALRGEHDLSSAPELAAALEAARPWPRVLIDLSECAFMDSTVLARLLSAHRMQVEHGERLELVLPSEPASSVPRLAKLSRVDILVPIHESLTHALDDGASGVRAP
jgi:anti-anti-sigma factor